MVTPQQMQALEKQALAAGASAETLMEEAGRQMAEAVSQFCPVPGQCAAVFGKGHNGGDALVAARLLSEAGWQVLLVPAYPTAAWAPLTARKWDQAGRCSTIDPETFRRWRPAPATTCVLLDGLLGVGARPRLPETVAQLSRRINTLRETSAARTFALDLPTGLDGATGKADPDAVIADVTLTVGFVKSGLLTDGAERWVGRLALLPLDALKPFAPDQPSLELATPESLRPLWPRRPAHLHKGDCGRVTLLAGARGTVGAAALAARGALRAGAGLVTLCVPEAAYAAAIALAPAECMVQPLGDFREALDLRSDALGIGPGLGRAHPDAVTEVLRDTPWPAVLDADAPEHSCRRPNRIPRAVCRTAASDPPPQGDVPPFSRPLRTGPAGCGGTIHRTLAGHAAAQGSPHACWDRRRPTELQHHGKSRNGLWWHGRRAHRRLRRPPRAGPFHAYGRVAGRMALRSFGGGPPVLRAAQ